MEPIRLLKENEIECRIGTISEKGVSLLLYKDARADMKVLDETYGTMNWQRKHEMIGANLYCIVSIWDKEKSQWISKMDVGTESYAEKEKGQSSDSFKRACTVVGIGRELYTAGFIWIPAAKVKIQQKDGRYSTYDRFFVRQISYNKEWEINGLVICNQNGEVVYTMQKNAGIHNESIGRKVEACEKKAAEDKVIALNRELIRTGVSLDAVLQRYGVNNIEEMSDAVYRSAMNSLKKSRDRAA